MKADIFVRKQYPAYGLADHRLIIDQEDDHEITGWPSGPLSRYVALHSGCSHQGFAL